MMTMKKRQAHEIDGISVSSFAPFASEKDHELFIIERDLLARVVLKQHCAYRRIDIIDRIKSVLKGLDRFLSHPQTRAGQTDGLHRLIGHAAERFFQQLSMGLMIPMSTVCLGAFGRLTAILHRINLKANGNIPLNISGLGYTIDEDEGIQIDR